MNYTFYHRITMFYSRGIKCDSPKLYQCSRYIHYTVLNKNNMKKKNVKKQYRNIRKREEYFQLLLSGMFYEFHPELTGVWKSDKKTMKKGNILTVIWRFMFVLLSIVVGINVGTIIGEILWSLIIWLGILENLETFFGWVVWV